MFAQIVEVLFRQIGGDPTWIEIVEKHRGESHGLARYCIATWATVNPARWA
jgi:hypothetical protein